MEFVSLRGAYTTSSNSKINPGTPELADLLWVRARPNLRESEIRLPPAEKPMDSHWAFGPVLNRTLVCSPSKVGKDVLRLEDGTIFNLPTNISDEEQEKWRNETKVNFAIAYLEETDQWEMKLRNVRFALLANEDWDTRSANGLQARFPKLDWNKATSAATDQKKQGFYSLLHTRGMNPPMTFAFETTEGQRGVFQFRGSNSTSLYRDALIRYKRIHEVDPTKWFGG
jgi:hypothetical protein